MSFFGNSNNNTSTGFGGFGSSNTGFGANNNTATSGSIFGSNTATSGGFGSAGGFGSNTGFGAKPATMGFGSTTASGSGGLFGNNANTTGGFGSGGGFGSTNTANTGFGGQQNTGGSLFGQSKPASTGFGSNTGGSIFGGGGGSANTTGGFGNSNNNTQSNPFGGSSSNTGFGAANTDASAGGFGGFGSSNAVANNNGTAGTPFSAFSEKDGTSNQTSYYQSITFQQPYQKKSFEELRVEDYLQGRRFGNNNGQAGSFGVSTGFGGSTFGANNNTNSSSSLFGGQNNNSSSAGFGGFGTNQAQNSGGFGNNTSGGLFGQSQNKPATGGLFGSTQTSGATGGAFGSTTSGSAGGLFGGGGGTGFGSNQNQTQNTSGGLFGSNNTQQNKPAFGGFGASNNTGGFGGSTTTGSGLFGSSTNPNTNTGGGLFGQNNQQQQQSSNPFGTSSNTGGGLFGSTQNKPASGGLFGSNTNSGGGLFGANNTQQQQSGGLFGSNTNTQQSGGLFGNTQNKPASTGLFGASTTNTNTGGGLFGAQNNQQQQQSGNSLFGGNTGGSSLFGGNNQNKPATGGLFGSNTTTSNAGGGLFGQSNQSQQNNTGGGLFGSMGQNSQSQQNNNSSLFGSTSFNGQNQTPQQSQNQLHASLTLSPYGNDQLFSSLGQSSAPIGPLATPLQGARPAPSKTPSLLSSTRLNSPVYTPRASTLNRGGTYGFTYSTVTTPGSAYSASLTPQQSSLLKPTGSLGSALTSRLAKSMSVSNLRSEGFPRDSESLLRPSPSGLSRSFLKSGSMRKLTIDRSLRTDLFAPPGPKQIESSRSVAENESSALRKRVSFDNSVEKESTAEPSANNALVRQEEEETQEQPALFRAGPKPAPQDDSTPAPQHANGTALITAPEDGETRRSSAPATQKPADQKAALDEEREGDYWTQPSTKDLKNMSRQQLSKLGKFTVGREGCGHIEFGPCDLTNTNLDDICGKLVIFRPRSATVYQEDKDKPEMGKGLNVPSTIHLYNSYPKHQSQRQKLAAGDRTALERHTANLAKVKDTQFVNYDIATGTWTFKVPHFTTYELEEGDEDSMAISEEMDVQQESSGLSEPPEDATMPSIQMADGVDLPQDDTFGHKKRLQFPAIQVPGGFEEIVENFDASGEYGGEVDASHDFMMSGGLSVADDDVFDLKDATAHGQSSSVLQHSQSSMAHEDDSEAVDFAEQTQGELDFEHVPPGSFIAEEPKMLRSILKPTARLSMLTAPEKLANESWEEQLQRTLSPKKRDRQALKDLQQSVLREPPEDLIESPFKRSVLGTRTLSQSALGHSYLAQKKAEKSGLAVSALGGEQIGLGKSQAFRTSMDIMNSLWAQEKPTAKGTVAAGRGFEIPYPKKPRISAPPDLNEQDAAFFNSMKPSFSNQGVVVYAAHRSAALVDAPLVPALQPLVNGHKEVRFAKLIPSEDPNTSTVYQQKLSTDVIISNGFPIARTRKDMPLRALERETIETGEKAIWKLASILFDPVEQACEDVTRDMSAEWIALNEHRLRLNAFADLWKGLVSAGIEQQMMLANSAEEKALLRLTVNDLAGAVNFLIAAKNFKLATLVAQLPGSSKSREVMRAQIEVWRERNDWSEMSDGVRALYSIVAGETCHVLGKSGPAENRVSSFCISAAFDLDWKQSFALRVLFGGQESLHEAAVAYIADLQSAREQALPVPSWANDETTGEGREDVLLGLLRLATSRADADAVFDPKTISGSCVNSRVAWQLATFLHAKGFAPDLTEQKLDQLTQSFASELEADQRFVTAAWVLLHLHDHGRKKAVTDLLYRNAGPEHIGVPKADEIDADSNWEYLTSAGNLRLPEEVLWSAKALYAKARSGNEFLQTAYLLNAHAYEEAHMVLCEFVGPQAVIEEEYDELTELLNHFNGLARDQRVEGWERGGKVFDRYHALVTFSTSRKHGAEGRQVMEELNLGLDAMRRAGEEKKMTLEQRVALVEMERVLREEAREADVHFQRGSTSMEIDGVAGVATGIDAFARFREAVGVVA